LSDTAAAYAIDAVGEQWGSEAASVVGSVLDSVRRAQHELGTGPEVFGMIHADLHQENYLFKHGDVRAIDFDDCGWGHFAYELTVPLSELRWRADYPDLRAALLRGYRATRPFPVEQERHVEAFSRLRTLLLTLWFLEMRGHPSFPDWEREAREGIADLRSPAGRST
jgi:Ser/Thr protein kinase RdoA (MazF antagonist)